MFLPTTNLRALRIPFLVLLLMGFWGCEDELANAGEGPQRIVIEEDREGYTLEPVGFQETRNTPSDTFEFFIGHAPGTNITSEERYIFLTNSRFRGRGSYPIGYPATDTTDTFRLEYYSNGRLYRGTAGVLTVSQMGQVSDTLDSGEPYQRTFSLSGDLGYRAVNDQGDEVKVEGSFTNLRALD